MSHSLKKTPIVPIACCNQKTHRKAKKRMTRDFRHNHQNDEIPSGTYYRKFEYDWRWRPDDGRAYAPDYQKSLRK